LTSKKLAAISTKGVAVVNVQGFGRFVRLSVDSFDERDFDPTRKGEKLSSEAEDAAKKVQQLQEQLRKALEKERSVQDQIDREREQQIRREKDAQVAGKAKQPVTPPLPPVQSVAQSDAPAQSVGQSVAAPSEQPVAQTVVVVPAQSEQAGAKDQTPRKEKEEAEGDGVIAMDLGSDEETREKRVERSPIKDASPTNESAPKKQDNRSEAEKDGGEISSSQTASVTQMAGNAGAPVNGPQPGK
jgi:hypothetical protein